jgi:hypothetical protein
MKYKRITNAWQTHGKRMAKYSKRKFLPWQATSLFMRIFSPVASATLYSLQ